MKLLPLGFLKKAGKKRDFTAVNSGLANVWHGVSHAPLANGNWFAHGFASNGGTTNAYRSSFDTATWTARTMPVSRLWGRSATNGSRIVATAQTAATTLYYSDNGTTWTAATVWSTNRTTYDIIYNGSVFYALASNRVAYSTDGATWTESGNDIGTSYGCIGWNKANTYISTRNLSTSIATARIKTDGDLTSTSWANITLPSAQVWGSPVYGNGTWIVFRIGGTEYATSTNGGTTWTARTLPSDFSNRSLMNQAVFNDGWFYVRTDGGSGITRPIYKSQDGITWEVEQNDGPDTVYITAWATNGQYLLGVGSNRNTEGALDFLRGE
jgi:hypothetical protein